MIKETYKDGPVHFVLLTTCYVINAIVHDVDMVPHKWLPGIYSYIHMVNKRPVLHHNYIRHSSWSLFIPFFLTVYNKIRMIQVQYQRLPQWYVTPPLPGNSLHYIISSSSCSVQGICIFFWKTHNRLAQDLWIKSQLEVHVCTKQPSYFNRMLMKQRKQFLVSRILIKVWTKSKTICIKLENSNKLPILPKISFDPLNTSHFFVQEKQHQCRF